MNHRLPNRLGSSSLGCLTWLALLAGVAYAGAHIAEPYFRYYEYRDAITQEARFATLRTDDAIQKNIWTNADSLALPEDAYHVKITRTPRSIRIRAAYDDSWTIASYTRPVHFTVDVDHPL